MIAWVVGGSGLIGRAIVRRMHEHGIETLDLPEIAWADATRAHAELADGVRALAERAGDGEWLIAWAAGVATTSTTAEAAQGELAALRALVEAVRVQRPSGPGAFLLTSSAGGVYAGSVGAPFDASTAIAPISPYGELKAAQEQAARDVLAGVCPVVIGRVSNAYGPGQDLTKLQGLISQLAHAAAVREPINMFVSLDTIRDYVWVDDLADQAIALARRGIERGTSDASVGVIASGEPMTLAALIHTVESVTKRRIPLALGSHPSAKAQVLDLRMTPTLPSDERPHTPLPVGIRRVYDDVLSRL